MTNALTDTAPTATIAQPQQLFSEWSKTIAQGSEAALARLLPAQGTHPARLHDAMRYACLGGGKRVRAMLVMGAGAITSAPVERLAVLASAVEMIHAYSLIHDDLPCMDDDVLRRGKPTCHIEFDEATALLAGDALQARAFELFGEHSLADTPALQLEMLALFAHACGSRGMAGGQAIDLACTGHAINQTELEYLHMLKTGALICGAVLLGALAGRSITKVERERLTHYGQCIGLAFQVVDDVLDESADTATLGKTAGKDKDAGKTTYVSLMGIPRARELAQTLIDDAVQTLAPFGAQAAQLQALARFIVERVY